VTRTRLIGLTGGIASGKSTVGRMLRELGAEVIDADQLARDVVAPGQPALAEITEAFGPEVLASDGTLDRKRLAARVFSDPAARATLNRITHPRVAAETARRMGEASRRGLELVVYEVPLLVENGLQAGMDAVIVVDVPPELQLARAVERDGMTEEEARRRMAAQVSRADRLAAATHVIDNAGPIDETRRRTEEVWRALGGRIPDAATHEPGP
jgi:dephospho-CoA kinase